VRGEQNTSLALAALRSGSQNPVSAEGNLQVGRSQILIYSHVNSGLLAGPRLAIASLGRFAEGSV